MMLRKIISFLSFIELARSSLVIDSKSQGNINVNDYCPKMKHCPEGAHVLCMYEQNKMGPLCTDAKEIPLTRDKIQKILDVTNMIRSRIARGKERGQDDELLPRGYGIFRLKWDPVLSAFAQVLTNQCVLGHDFCRATNKFPDPSQIAGMFRYKLNWDPVKGKDFDFEPGFNNKKVIYALNRVLHSWYDHRTSVTANHTTSFPDYDSNPLGMRGRLYLRMVYGSATHIGCGMTAYSQFNFKHDVKTNDGSFLLVICNLSASPHRGTSVFNTVPPGDTTVLSNPCGCPAGSMGDDMCLCVDAEEDPRHHKEPDGTKRACTDGMDCDPALMVLPIFTMEDAPPEKLIHTRTIHTALISPKLSRACDMGTSYMNATKRKNGMDHYLDRSSENIWQDLTRKSGLDVVSDLVKYPAVQTPRHGESSSQDSKAVGQYVPTIPRVTAKPEFLEKSNEATKTSNLDKNAYLEDLRKKYLNQNADLEDLRNKYLNQNANLEDLKKKYLKQNANLEATRIENANLEALRIQNANLEATRIKNANIEALQTKYLDNNANVEAPRTKYHDKNSNQEAPRTALFEKNAIHAATKTVTLDKNLSLNKITNLDAQRTVFDDKNHIEPQENIEQHKPIQRVTRKKESIFSRPAKFQLPLDVYDHIKLEHRVEIKDVVPRKDFSKAKQLLDKYLYDKHPIMKGIKINNKQVPNLNKYNKDSDNINNDNLNQKVEQSTVVQDQMHHVLSILRATKPKKTKDIQRNTKTRSTSTEPPSTDNVLNFAEQNIMKEGNLDDNVSKNNDYNGVVNKITEDADNRLMALLDTLEQEVKHIELREKDRRLFDEKIRKIYGKVVGKPVNAIDFKTRTEKKPSKLRRRMQDVRDLLLKKKSVQQDRRKTVTEKEWTVKEGLEDLVLEPKYSPKNKYTNTSIREDQHESELYSERNVYKEIYDNSRTKKRNYGERPLSNTGLEERHVIRNIGESNRYDNKGYRERDRYIEEDKDMRSERRNVVGFDRSRTRSYHSRRDNVMSRDRRQYYQDKLDNLERRLQTRIKSRKNTPTHMRPVKSENQMDLYGRARFAHGY